MSVAEFLQIKILNDIPMKVMDLNGNTGQLRIGGGISPVQGIDGEILIFSRRQSIDDPNHAAMIWMNARSPGIRIRSLDSTNDVVNRIELNGGTATIKCGGKGRDGTISLVDGLQDLFTASPKIFLDSRTSEITLSNNPEDGRRINLNGEDASILIREQGKNKIMLEGPNGRARLGGGGAMGEIRLLDVAHDNNGPSWEGVTLNAAGLLMLSPHTTLNRHRLKIGEQNTGSGFHYSLSTGNLKLGGGSNVNQDADILLYKGAIDIEDASPEDSSIHLSAGNSRIDLRRSSNKINTIALDGNAGNIGLRSPSDGAVTFYFEAINGNLKLGGGSIADNADGDILLYRKGVDIKSASASDASIDLGSEECKIAMRGDGRETIIADAKNGNIKLGGGDPFLGGVDGDILLYPAGANISTDPASQATIHLDGGTGDIILRNADCAEEFDVDEEEDVSPGDVVIMSDNGKLRKCSMEYDTRVAGVISGAQGNKPGIILGRNEKTNRMPLALLGKVYCKVDTAISPINIGDMLTTSSDGYAMKAVDPVKSRGSVLGKALGKLNTGKELIPILVTLQ